MVINQLEVYITDSELGRAAIVARSDNFIQIYVHWILSNSGRKSLNVADGGRTSWRNDETPLDELYNDIAPEPGIYQNIDDARAAIKLMSGFSESQLLI